MKMTETRMIDIRDAGDVEVQLDKRGVFYLHIDGLTVLRIQGIMKLEHNLPDSTKKAE